MTRISTLYKINYPIIQAGMIWCSGWRLASAVSNAGGLGLLGAGSMYPDVLENHILKCKEATDKPFGVNIPLMYPNVEQLFEIIIRHKVPIVFTSAGNPAKYTSYLKDHGIIVTHVVANTKSAVKCQQSGVDAIVAEGFEAGGHNGKEETTTMVLIPAIRKVTDLPLIAAGGIGCGSSMLAAFALGAEGVQIGSAFVVAEESSAHPAFKQRIIDSREGDTRLSLKQLIPVRLLQNTFSEEIRHMEESGATPAELAEKLGKGRAKLGMFEGNMEEGELEIGQISSSISKIQPAQKIITDIIVEFECQRKKMCSGVKVLRC